MAGPLPECGQWGTIEEFHEARPAASKRTAAPGRTSRTQSHAVPASAAKPVTEIGTENIPESARVCANQPHTRRRHRTRLRDAHRRRAGHRQIDTAAGNRRQRGPSLRGATGTQHGTVYFRRGIASAGAHAGLTNRRGRAESATGRHHRPVDRARTDRAKQACAGHCRFRADHPLAGSRRNFRRVDAGARSGARPDRHCENA